MYLTRLLYVSKRNVDVDCNVEQILESARTFNKKAEVTGALWFNGDIFIQALEGGRRAVSTVYHRIAADPRHKDIELVACSAVHERLFYKWSMGYYADTEKNRQHVLRYSGHDALNPKEMSPDSLLGFLQALEMKG